MEIKELDEYGIFGDLYIPTGETKIGLIQEVGTTGNRKGLKHYAQKMCELPAYVAVLESSAHGRHAIQNLSFAVNATYQRQAARFLRKTYGLETVIGGGHSGGAITGVFAELGFTPSIEKRLMNKNDFSELLTDYIQTFDGLILGSMPLNARKVMPKIIQNKLSIRLFHKMFHKQNDTNNKNLTDYRACNNCELEFQHYRIREFHTAKQYTNNLINPIEFLNMLKVLDCDITKQYVQNFQSLPKISFVGTRDILIFGPFAHLFGASGRKMQWYEKVVNDLGNTEHHTINSSHFLNYVDRYETDSLWGMRSQFVQDRIKQFISNHYL